MTTDTRTSRSRGFAGRGILAGSLVLAAGGIAYWYVSPNPAPAAAPSVRTVPVSVEPATRRDVPVYTTGLGVVQAYLTVAVHSQVDGALQEVLFTEGQKVKKGDILARIDPRLFRAALDQAKAKQAQDEALLVAAEKDLTRFKTLALKSYGTEQSVDQQQAKVDQLKASLPPTSLRSRQPRLSLIIRPSPPQTMDASASGASIPETSCTHRMRTESWSSC